MASCYCIISIVGGCVDVLLDRTKKKWTCVLVVDVAGR